MLALTMLLFAACDESGEQVKIKKDIESNVLSPIASSLVLKVADKDKVAQHFEWESTDYGFAASITYKLQVDKTGNDFSAPFDLATTATTETDITVGKLNEGLLALELTPEEAASVEFRVVSTIAASVDSVFSTIQSTSATPYATSFPSIWGMGAGLKGWGPWPGNAVEWPSSEFKKYSTVAHLTNGEAFRWFNQLDWSPTSWNYPFFTSVSPVLVNAADGDSNLRVAGATGWYKIDIDLVAKTVVATPAAEPIMYMTGAGIGGWDKPGTGASIKMTFIKPGVWEGNATFVNGETFRFFAQPDWGPTSYNYPFFTTVDPKFVNAADGDSNLRVTAAAAGAHKVRININEGVKTVEFFN